LLSNPLKSEGCPKHLTTGTLSPRWRSGPTVPLDQCRNRWRCATHVQTNAKARNAIESSPLRNRSEFMICPATETLATSAANGRFSALRPLVLCAANDGSEPKLRQFCSAAKVRLWEPPIRSREHDSNLRQANLFAAVVQLHQVLET